MLCKYYKSSCDRLPLYTDTHSHTRAHELCLIFEGKDQDLPQERTRFYYLDWNQTWSLCAGGKTNIIFLRAKTGPGIGHTKSLNDWMAEVLKLAFSVVPWPGWGSGKKRGMSPLLSEQTHVSLRSLNMHFGAVTCLLVTYEGGLSGARPHLEFTLLVLETRQSSGHLLPMVTVHPKTPGHQLLVLVSISGRTQIPPGCSQGWMEGWVAGKEGADASAGTSDMSGP